jgi:hypothetical protein
LMIWIQMTAAQSQIAQRVEAVEAKTVAVDVVAAGSVAGRTVTAVETLEAVAEEEEEEEEEEVAAAMAAVQRVTVMPMQMAILDSTKNHAGKELVDSGNTAQRGEQGARVTAMRAQAVAAAAYKKGGAAYSMTGGTVGAEKR